MGYVGWGCVDLGYGVKGFGHSKDSFCVFVARGFLTTSRSLEFLDERKVCPQSSLSHFVAPEIVTVNVWFSNEFDYTLQSIFPSVLIFLSILF